jgi:hypothetical protein
LSFPQENPHLASIATEPKKEPPMSTQPHALESTLDQVLGPDRTARLFHALEVPPGILAETGDTLSRAGIAQALNMMLFEDLLSRVPDAKAYEEDSVRHGRKIMHDHGAVRTVLLDGMGALPAGEEAITRILRPLGYTQLGLYPLERLKMTGRSHAQAEYPEQIAQFFISELHPERFSEEFQAAVKRVMSTSHDPLDKQTNSLLTQLGHDHKLSIADAARLLPALAKVFTRQHSEAALADHEILLRESAEMAWIATEGNSFNHATDRVPDVDQLAADQKALGRAMKATVETSQSGRVRQTALLAARVERKFKDEHGNLVDRLVPGSFYEFITRLPLPESEGRSGLDLSFDSSNAQGIFKMTASEKA